MTSNIDKMNDIRNTINGSMLSFKSVGTMDSFQNHLPTACHRLSIVVHGPNGASAADSVIYDPSFQYGNSFDLDNKIVDLIKQVCPELMDDYIEGSCVTDLVDRDYSMPEVKASGSFSTGNLVLTIKGNFFRYRPSNLPKRGDIRWVEVPDTVEVLLVQGPKVVLDEHIAYSMKVMKDMLEAAEAQQINLTTAIETLRNKIDYMERDV